MGFEPTTLSLARRCSTTEPLPPTNGFRPVVPRVGIEPTTRGFSVRCSTAELPRPKLHNTKEGRGQVSRYASKKRCVNRCIGTPGDNNVLTNCAFLWYLVITPPIDSLVGSRPPTKAVSVFVGDCLLITNVYIDGFNLYYRALKGTLPSDGWTCRSLPQNSYFCPKDTIH